jgi:hypothetical protein
MASNANKTSVVKKGNVSRPTPVQAHSFAATNAYAAKNLVQKTSASMSNAPKAVTVFVAFVSILLPKNPLKNRRRNPRRKPHKRSLQNKTLA